MTIGSEIQKKYLRLGFLLVFIFLSLIVVISYNQRKMFVNSNKGNLQILASEKAGLINVFLGTEKDKLLLISFLSDFKNVLLYPNDLNKIEIAKTRINEIKKIIPGISIINSNGIVIVGDIDIPGTNYSQHPYFLNKEKNITFTRYHDPLRNNDYYAIIGPVYGGVDGSTVIGRIAHDIEIDKLSSLLKERVGLNNDVYFVDDEGIVISSNVDDAPTQELKTGSVSECLGHLKRFRVGDEVLPHGDDIKQYFNYKNDDVFGAHAYILNLSGCIIAEKKSSEILKFSVTDSLKNILNPFLFENVDKSAK